MMQVARRANKIMLLADPGFAHSVQLPTVNGRYHEGGTVPMVPSRPLRAVFRLPILRSYRVE